MVNNHTYIQFFEWYLPNDGNHWNLLKEKAQELKELGICAVWIPPPYKGGSSNDVGYGVYDIWDLGEFDQKGTVRTKYGTKDQLLEAIEECKKNDIKIYCDVVLNHKMGADGTEVFKAQEVNPENRLENVSEPYDIESWTKFEFKGRNGKYSDFKWCFNHFTGTDYDNKNQKKAIFKIVGDNKDWAEDVDGEKGNYDYLMGADIDHRHPDVIKDLKNWAIWITETLSLSGFRLDATKHIDEDFTLDLLEHVNSKTGKNDFFAVGEYWKDSLDDCSRYIDSQKGMVSLFDVPLHYNFLEAANGGNSYDLTKIFEGTIVQKDPTHASTFVDNHDSQPNQSLQSWIPDWFKAHAYALILLREAGYPCVFYGDLYGISGDDPVPAKFEDLKNLLKARKDFAYGEQNDYFDHPNTIGWVRRGDEEHPNGLAVVMCNGSDGSKRMFVGEERKGEKWYDLLGRIDEEITIEEDGFGEFKASGGAVSAYTKRV